MTDFDEEFDDEGNDEVETQTQQVLDKNIRAQLREASKAKKELAELRAQLEAEREGKLFDKAGIPEDGLGSMFRKGYTGERTVEAIQKTAVDYGLLNATRSNNEANDSELEALRRTQGATTGGDGNSPDAEQLYLAQLAEAKTPEEIMSVVNGESAKKLGVFSQRGPL